jgi:hypothetical protein
MTVFVRESNTGKANASRGRARAANEDEVKSKARGGRVRGASRPDPATMRPPSGPDYNVACPHLRLEALPNGHPGQYRTSPPGNGLAGRRMRPHDVHAALSCPMCSTR